MMRLLHSDIVFGLAYKYSYLLKNQKKGLQTIKLSMCFYRYGMYQQVSVEGLWLSMQVLSGWAGKITCVLIIVSTLRCICNLLCRFSKQFIIFMRVVDVYITKMFHSMTLIRLLKVFTLRYAIIWQFEERSY